MQRADLLSANAKIFAGQGKALDQYANKNVKVMRRADQLRCRPCIETFVPGFGGREPCQYQRAPDGSECAKHT